MSAAGLLLLNPTFPVAVMSYPVRIGVDVGGTFTDVALVVSTGELITAKVPSTGDQSVGVIEGLKKACRQAGISPASIEQFSHSMTVSVNALLEETGARTALVTTQGFRDVLEIGRQNRPALYDLNADRALPLVSRELRFEVDERTTPNGIQEPVKKAQLHALAQTLQEQQVESVAVCFLHAYLHPENEQQAAAILREALEVPVSVSHEVLAEFREYERTSTTVIDAYVAPEMDAYLRRLEQRAAQAKVPPPRVMQANGGTADIATIRQRAVRTIMSGPAAGVVGARTTAKHLTDLQKQADTQTSSAHGLITFDMGGTSSDVSLVQDGAVKQTTNTVINGRPIKVPMVDVTTVGAGGGSIAWVDSGGALRVGPRSAGAEPGPACYGKGGTAPAVTDANLLLGYIGATSRLGGELTLDRPAAESAVEHLAATAGLASTIEAARGIYQIANAAMTRAIRAVTVERGHDPRGFSLAAFGGAGPMHAAALAEALEINRIVIPRACGVLSAFGLLSADESYDSVRTFRTRLETASPQRITEVFEELRAEVLQDISSPSAANITYTADLRYVGQSFEINVPVQQPFQTAQVAASFQRQHQTTYGYQTKDPVELVNLRASATIPGQMLRPRFTGGNGEPKTKRPAFFKEGFVTTPVYDWSNLVPQQKLAGPAIIEQRESTIVIPPHWKAVLQPDGSTVMHR